MASIGCAATLGGGVVAADRTFHVDYSQRPVAADLLAFDLSILSAEAEVDLAPKHEVEGKALGYLSVVELGPGSAAEKAAAKAGVPTLGDNPDWDSKLADIADPRWSKVVLDELAPALIAKGFDGFFLDTADSVARLRTAAPDRADKFAPELVKLIKALRAKFPGKEIIINRGFDLLPQLDGAVDGVMIESVYRTFDPASGTYRETAEADSKQLEAKVKGLVASGLPVYCVDYVAPADKSIADETANRLADLGASALITTPELDGVSIAPVHRELRKILVLYGWDETEKRPMWPIDTFTAERLQMPLEWMGYECEYLHVAKQVPPPSLAGRYAGVIFDAELEFPFGKELPYAEWAVRQKREGVKVLFAAQFPFASDDGMKEVADGFGLLGNCQAVHGAETVEIVRLDESVMNFETEVRPHKAHFTDLRAPLDGNSLLTLRAKVDGRSVSDYHPVFTAPWGGALLDPYITFMASPSHTLSLFDPFAFLQTIWPAGDFPAPDPTTRDGLRVFVSHIDGDGFASLSETKRGALCAEVVRDRILKKYPLPITVSIVEANTRAVEKVLNPEHKDHFETVAKSIFALPNVQAASHTFTHPYIWIPGDPDYQTLYETDRLVLHDTEDYGDIDYKREIVGSIDYIERELLPAGKKVEMLLWSGNCRPPAEAIRIVRELGIENMNGGETIATRRHNCLAAVAPRTMPWHDENGDELQIFAPNQNEYVYTQDWRGPFYGGFSSVIDTFRLTETPRRVKPVNVYYHFYSAANLGALRALEKVHDWAMAQQLHAMTAASFAAMTRDSRATQLYHNGGRDWTITNNGQLRTLRVPTSLGLPDMSRSAGVTGYNAERGQLYVHTDGRRKVRLVLETGRPAEHHLRLVSSSAPIEFKTLDIEGAEFAIDGMPEATVTFGGVAPGTKWHVAHDGEAGRVATADSEGNFTLKVPAGTPIQVHANAIALNN